MQPLHYGLSDRGIVVRFPEGAAFVSLHSVQTNSQPIHSPPPRPLEGGAGRGGGFLDGKGSQREADHLLPYYRVEAKKNGGGVPLLPHTPCCGS